MTIVSAFAVVLSLLAVPMFIRRASFAHYAKAVFLVMLHILTTQMYFIISHTQISDAQAYYFSESWWRAQPWTALSTAFVGHFTQFLKYGLGATYLDCFMVFQVFGAWGIVILMRIFDELQVKTRSEGVALASFLLFLPSLHFWTSAIGKDAPLLFCVALCVWSVLDVSKRTVPLLISLAVMVPFRAHIALAAGISLSLCFMLAKNVSFGRKAGLMAISAVGLSVLLYAVRTSFNVDLTDPSSMAQFMDTRAVAEAGDVGNTSFANASIVVRLASFLFRPLFFDANSVFGIIASFENVGSIFMFSFFAYNFRLIRRLANEVIFVRFCIYFSFVLLVLLGSLNYNIGLGLRQRTMMLPALLSLLIAVRSVMQPRRIVSSDLVSLRPDIAQQPAPQRRMPSHGTAS